MDKIVLEYKRFSMLLLSAVVVKLQRYLSKAQLYYLNKEIGSISQYNTIKM